MRHGPLRIGSLPCGILPPQAGRRDVSARMGSQSAATANCSERALQRGLADNAQMTPTLPSPSISIVVPVYRDAHVLARLLAWLGKEAVGTQIIVVDAGRQAECAALCDHHAVSYLPAQPCRGGQLNLGAAHATGDVLWFLHADARPPSAACRQIRAAIMEGAAGGAFGFALPEAHGITPRLIELGVRLRCRFGGVPYGDQGLFVRAECFRACGGFREVALFEEVLLVRCVQRSGRWVQLAAPIAVSPRRWLRDGWWRSIARNRALALGYAAGISPARLARWYRREPAARHAGK